MSILKNILRPFLEFKEETTSPSSKEFSVQKAGTKSGDSRQGSEPAATEPVTGSTYSSDASSGMSNHFPPTEYKKHFEELIEEANAKNPVFQGTDFKEFIDSKSDLDAIADEETKYKTAFNVLKRTGLTKERLITTGHQYINLVDGDLQGFNDAFVQQYKTAVEEKEKLLKNKADELKALNDKIEVLNKEMKQLSQEIIQSRDKLNSNKNSFVLAGENKKSEIKAELQKIEKYFS